jgi:very-short-patch-repair endonuclease
MRPKGAKVDAGIALIAARQHGVVSARQLMDLGFQRGAMKNRLATGRLHHVHRGVYAVGHPGLSPRGHWMAAALASGTGGVGDSGAVLDYWGATISHRSAAELWELLSMRNGAIDITVPGNGGKRRRRGIRVHRSLTLMAADVTLRRGIPVTTPARTIADLRRVVSKPGKTGLISPYELRRAIRQADVLGLPLGDDVGSDGTRSDLERDFLRLCGRYRLSVPEVNVRVGPHLVDFFWRDRKLIVETDSFIYHGGRIAFQDDRGRDLDLRALGFQVIRLSEKQVNEEPWRVAEVVSAALRVGADGSI